ncbi:hypothetical protein ACT453_59040, partial [Bacillus sp. D-CC]
IKQKRERKTFLVITEEEGDSITPISSVITKNVFLSLFYFSGRGEGHDDERRIYKTKKREKDIFSNH